MVRLGFCNSEISLGTWENLLVAQVFRPVTEPQLSGPTVGKRRRRYLHQGLAGLDAEAKTDHSAPGLHNLGPCALAPISGLTLSRLI
jgi:hypothetical protein